MICNNKNENRICNNSRNGPLRGPFPRPSGVGGIKIEQLFVKTSVGQTSDRQISVGRTPVGRTPVGRTHSNPTEKMLYIREKILFLLRLLPKLFYYLPLGERIPKMGLDLKSVHGKGSNFWSDGRTDEQTDTRYCNIDICNSLTALSGNFQKNNYYLLTFVTSLAHFPRNVPSHLLYSSSQHSVLSTRQLLWQQEKQLFFIYNYWEASV